MGERALDPALTTTSHTCGAALRRMLHRLYLPMATCARASVLADAPFLAPDALYAALIAADVRPTSPSTSAPSRRRPTTSRA